MYVLITVYLPSDVDLGPFDPDDSSKSLSSALTSGFTSSGGSPVKGYRVLRDAIFLYKFRPSLLNRGSHKDRANAKQRLLRWPCPLPSDRAIPVLWQNLESNVWRTHIVAHGRSPPWLHQATAEPATNRNHTRQEAHKHQAPVTPRAPDLSYRDAFSHHVESSALPTELRDRLK